jgi:hypothetical protein
MLHGITGKKQQTNTGGTNMKFNQWTLGLAAVGAVSLASAARADEAKLSALQTALSNTTISGYVSASANFSLTPNIGGTQTGATFGNATSPFITPNGGSPVQIPFQNNKQDGFNLDVVKVSIAKPQDESPWAAGYQVDLIFGPDAVGYNAPIGEADSAASIKQAYVVLRTPIGNGIDWKIGTFDTVIGYESFDAGSNPNYTRSYGWNLEPTEHTGILASYKINDEIAIAAGVANTLSAGINSRAYNQTFYPTSGGPVAQGYTSDNYNKTYMGSITLTAPSSWGWVAGSSLSAGVVYGWAGSSNGSGPAYTSTPGNYPNYAGGDQINYYAGLTLNTPIKQLTLGAAFDYVQNWQGGAGEITALGFGADYHEDVWVAGLYATVNATDKLHFSVRGEYLDDTTYQANASAPSYNPSYQSVELTGTVEYDLWANVVSRVEVRYDKIIGGLNNAAQLADSPDQAHSEALGIYANIIYKF